MSNDKFESLCDNVREAKAACEQAKESYDEWHAIYRDMRDKVSVAELALEVFIRDYTKLGD